MKKTKSLFCAMVLSTVLAGNVFAGVTTGVGVYSLFGSLYAAVVSMVSGSREECPPRQCQNCRPNDRDHDGNCRPTEQ